MTEVAMMARLKEPPISPYVIQMLEWFDFTDHIKIIMEYPRPCRELGTLILCGALDEEKIRLIMLQAVQAVKNCLDHGVFHNDIHPWSTKIPFTSS